MSNTKLTILIVDDNENNLISLRAVIEKNFSQANVIDADSGLHALSILLRQSVDLIFLDIQMPNMDGFETAQMIRSREKIRDVPIIFLTAAYKSDDFKKKGFDVGGTDYLTKPIDSNLLVDKIRLYLRFVQKANKNDEINIPEDNLAESMQSSVNNILLYNQYILEKVILLECENCLANIDKINAEGNNLIKSLKLLSSQIKK